jgi:AcrR family transcriptional regulator
VTFPGPADQAGNPAGRPAGSAGRRGRRGGATASRDHILDAARRLFAEHGFDGTSLRQVARAAGVDPGMIHHFFSGKDELFALSVELPADPEQVLAGMAESDPDQRAELMVRTVLRLWESPAQAGLLAFVRGTIGSTARTSLLREAVARRVISRITASVPGPPQEVALRGSLVATQIVGLMMVRYVVRLEPLASAPAEDVVRLVAPTVQRYLTGPI